MTLSHIQQAFIDIGTQYSTGLLEAYFNLNSNDDSEGDPLDRAELLAVGCEVGILLAGTLSAPATVGISFGSAVLLVMLSKTARKCYKWYKDFSEESLRVGYPDVLNRDVKQLRMQIQLQRAMHQCAIRYAYALHEIVDKKSLYQFSEQTAARLMKIMLMALHENPQHIPDAEDLLDGLLASAKLSATQDIDSVTIQHPRSKFGPIKSSQMPSKLLWARPIWYVFDSKGDGELMGSRQEHALLKTTTMRECGMISIPRDKLALATLAVNISEFRPLTEDDVHQPLNQLVAKLYFPHIITRIEVEDYLESVRQSGASPPHSLNVYLSHLLGKSVIAVCHTNTLSGMNLSGGCFSGVDFYHADLSGCNLCDTDWSGRYTWLSNATFNQVILNENTNFQAVHAEESQWSGVTFVSGVNVSLTKFNGATLVDCTIHASGMLQLGTDWLLACFINLRVEDASSNLEMKFQTKLNLEQQQRLQLEHHISQIDKACKEQSMILQTAVRQIDEITTEFSTKQLKEALISLKEEIPAWISDYNAHLTQLSERCDLLEKVILHDEVAIAALKNFRQEEDERWSEQYSADLWRDQRITLLEPRQSVVNRLLHYYKEEINTTSHQLIKRTYIELQVSDISASNQAEFQSLTACLDKYVGRGENILLLHGEPGCGKSITLKLLFEERLMLWLQSFNQPSRLALSSPNFDKRLIPILIDFYQVQDVGRNSLRSGLECYLDKSQVDYLIEHESLLIMIDNFDVSSISLPQFLRDCADLSANCVHKPKIIFATKTSYLLSLERDYRQIFVSHGLNLEAEYLIHPFDTSQIKRFLSLYHGETAYHRFQAVQAQNAEVRAMLNSPLMLSIIVSAFFSSSFNEQHIEYRSDLYAAAWHALYERVRHLLPDAYKEYADFIGMIQRLAIAIFEQGQDWIERPFERQLQGRQTSSDPLACLFQAKIRYLLSLSITKKNDILHIRFMHPSLGHYWVAQSLLADLFEKNFLSDANLRWWNLRSLREFPDIENFLVELIQQNAEKDLLLNRLMDIVRLTKQPAYQSFAIAASNAITIRCRLNKNFNQLDLSHISIPRADLTEGQFVGTVFCRSNLSDVRFTRATLLWANLQDANLTKTQFLDAAGFIQTDGLLDVFAVYPSLQETIIAFVVKPEQFPQSYKILLVSVQEGITHKLNIWSAHRRKIMSLVWGIADGKALLASAGEAGSIRIWTFNHDEQNNVQEMVKLSDAGFNRPISILAWGPNSQWIASGSEDGCLGIWDIAMRQKIYHYSAETSASFSPIHALLWGNLTNVLLTSDDCQRILFWQDPEKPMPESRLHQIGLQTLNTQNPSPVRCMALSWREQQLAIGYMNGEILVINISDASLEPLRLSGHRSQVNALCWAGPRLISSSTDHTARVWYHTKLSKILQHEHAVGDMAVLPSGRELVTEVSSASPRLYFWNIDKLHEERFASDPLGSMMCFAVQPDTSSGYTNLAVGFVTGSVMLYRIDKQTRQANYELIWEHDHRSVSQLIWSKDGRFLASFCKDGELVIKNIHSMSEPLLMVQREKNIKVNHMAWITKPTHSSLFVASLSDGSMGIYDAMQIMLSENGHVLKPLHGISTYSESSLLCFAMTDADDEHALAKLAVSRGKFIEIWTIALDFDTQFVSTIQCTFDRVDGLASSLLWSPDGQHLLSVSNYRTIEIWDQRFTRIYHDTFDDEIKCMSWSDKGLIIGMMNKILVWDTHIEDIWSQAPQCVSMGGSMLVEDGGDIILAENGGIWICNQEVLLATNGPESWVMQVKPGLLMHQANASGIKASPSTQELLAQKGGIVPGALEKYSLFGSGWGRLFGQKHYKLSPPSSYEALHQHRRTQYASERFKFNDDLSELASGSTPRLMDENIIAGQKCRDFI